MRHKNNDFIFRIVPVVIGTFIAAMFFNIIYQAQISYRKNTANAEIAVFIYKSYELSAFEVKRKILSLENINQVRYVPSTDTYKDVLGGSSQIKDILLSGENPFSSYFLVKLENNSLKEAESLKNKIAMVNGVEDVKYDQDIFIFSEKLQKIKTLYLVLMIACAVILFINAAVKIIYKLNTYEAEYMEYLYSAAWGILLGLIGIVIYYLLVLYIFRYEEFFIPLKYILLVWPVGIFLNIALKD